MKHFLLLFLLLGLVACGSSSNSGPASAAAVASDEASKGTFIDSPVENLGYRLRNRKGNFSFGRTDKNGQFSYQDGDLVTFYLGTAIEDETARDFGAIQGIVFPEVMAQGVVSPLSYSSSLDFDDQIVINIARILQSLDSDGDPTIRRYPGEKDKELVPHIHIRDVAHETAVEGFLDLYTENLEREVSLFIKGAGKPKEKDNDAGAVLVSAESAVEHLRESLAASSRIESIRFSGNQELEACVKEHAEFYNWIYADDVTELICKNKRLRSLAGIEYFRNINTLDISKNQLQVLDLYDEPNAISFLPKLRNINFSDNPYLEKVDVSHKQLTQISTEGLPALKELRADGNRVSVLHVETAVSLTLLSLNFNTIIEADLSNNLSLNTISLKGNPLSDSFKSVLETVFGAIDTLVYDKDP